MVETKTAEKTEKTVKERPNEGANLHVSNQDFATAQAAGRGNETAANVIENGQMKFTALYGPQGVNSEVATPLGQAAPPIDARTPADRATIAPITDHTGATTDKPVNAADIQASKTRLEALTKGMSPDQAAEVQKDMQAIENRQPPLTAHEINGIYSSSSKLLEDPDHTSPLSQGERNQLAASILHNASLRTGVDQGFHNTCNVTTLERRLNVVNPAEAARIVADVGLKGHYDSGGRTIQLDAGSLHADSEASMRFGDKRTDGKRDYASQIFDQATINDYWQRQRPPLYYSQEAPTSQSDTGERLRFENGQEVPGPDGKPMRQPGLSADAIGAIGKRLGFEGQYILANAEVAGQTDTDGVSKIHSYQKFADALASGSPPQIIMVNANDKLFGGTGDKGGSGGWHVVTASNYEAGPPARVFMTNQWGSENNKWVNVSDLYNSSVAHDSDRVDQNGQPFGNQGGGNQGGDNGGNQGGTDHRGWSRNDGVMRDEDYSKWRQDLVDQYIKKDDPNHKNNQTTVEQLAPLQSMLDEARSKQDSLQIDLIQHRIQDILNSH